MDFYQLYPHLIWTIFSLCAAVLVVAVPAEWFTKRQRLMSSKQALVIIVVALLVLGFGLFFSWR